MCGIAGFITSHELDRAHVLHSMVNQLHHRGPDDKGIWFDELKQIGLGHARLSIVDLSRAGHQPMLSPSDRFVIVFNGEIYNHLELREQLSAGFVRSHNWRGHSDTETLLVAIEQWGLEKTLNKTSGMFAMALCDNQDKTLTLARDRMGEKPLYYGWANGSFVFGSELKAIKAHPHFYGEVDRNALTLLLRHNCIPAPYSIYKGIYKLLPGHYLTVPINNRTPEKDIKSHAYWSLNESVTSGLANPFGGTDGEAIDLLETQLSTSISEQMLADVPLGAFLSGGVDSSSVVALMQAQSPRPVRTFTIGFGEGGYDEAKHAKEVARCLGTEHTELYVSAEDALAIIPRLPGMYCEPFSDSSQIPTFLLSQMARKYVTVALSGDGGDELFGGYNRYLSAREVWSKMQIFPGFARYAAASMLRGISPIAWDRLFRLAKPLLPGRLHLAIPGDKAHKLADVLNISNQQAFFHQLTSHWNDPASLVIGSNEPATLLTNSEAWPKTDCFEHWMMAMDAQTYLADDILVKIDRAAMASSLETRVPMLDHRVVDLAWKMPLHMKIRDGQGKWLLREVLYRHVPRKLIERPKKGFGIPLDNWLRGPLREWAEELLNENRL
jgi:asparagine synthase (glutamine-hydrolysing)